MFSKAWTLMRIRGIPIRLHISLALVLPFLAWSVSTNQLPQLLRSAHVPAEALTLPASLLGVLVALALFVGIALHELGHALVALRQGGHVKGITLMLLGGVAEIDHEGATPRQQAWMAFAGPLVSLILGIGSLALSLVDGLLLDLRAALYIFGGMNLALAIFNLIPAYPLDGGRILRALLAARLQPMRATRISASVGRVLALCGVGFALMLPDPMLLLVSVFVFLGASADEAATTMRLGLAGLRARQAMARRVASVEPSRSLSSVARHMLFQGASAAIVRDAQSVRGVLGVRDVQRGPLRRADEVLEGEAVWVHADDDLSEVVGRIQKSKQSGAIVVDDMNTIVGVVTYEDLARAVALRGAADAPGVTPPAPTVPARQDARR
jgi:Zn-dependent protease/predicted transcriptional regulator